MNEAKQDIQVAIKFEIAGLIAEDYGFNTTLTDSMICIGNKDVADKFDSIDEYLGFMRGWQSANKFRDEVRKREGIDRESF